MGCLLCCQICWSALVVITSTPSAVEAALTPGEGTTSMCHPCSCRDTGVWQLKSPAIIGGMRKTASHHPTRPKQAATKAPAAFGTVMPALVPACPPARLPACPPTRPPDCPEHGTQPGATHQHMLPESRLLCLLLHPHSCSRRHILHNLPDVGRQCTVAAGATRALPVHPHLASGHRRQSLAAPLRK